MGAPRVVRRRLAQGRARAGARLRGRAELVLPLARLALGRALGRGQDVLDDLLLLLHRAVGDVRAVRRLVAARLAREAAVGVAERALVVALEGVEVVVVAGLLRVPGVEAGLLGIEAPDVVPWGDVEHLRGRAGLD